VIPRPYQISKANEAFDILAKNMIVYLAMEERTGKTLVALLVCERARVNNVLVITKKRALEGWQKHLTQFAHAKQYTVVNYHQAKKLNPKDFDIVVLDEAHNYISSFPKRSAMWADIKKLTTDKPLIYLSATPYAQGTQLLYNPLALSSWSPFKGWSSPYNWFRAFGIPDPTYLAGRVIESYKVMQTEEVLNYVSHLLVTGTRKELGFTHEPVDELHYLTLNEATTEVYNLLIRHKALELNGFTVSCDTPMKLRTTLHMLEGGVLKSNGIYVVLGNTEKIDYIKKTWGDTTDVAIMYQYIAEGKKLRAAFDKAEVLQATSFAEGVDLAHKQHLIVYSQDFSTARHTQRRARQAGSHRDQPINVHFLLVKDAVSEQVYQTVSVNKTNFVDSVFERNTL